MRISNTLENKFFTLSWIFFCLSLIVVDVECNYLKGREKKKLVYICISCLKEVLKTLKLQKYRVDKIQRELGMEL